MNREEVQAVIAQALHDTECACSGPDGHHDERRSAWSNAAEAVIAALETAGEAEHAHESEGDAFIVPMPTSSAAAINVAKYGGRVVLRRSVGWSSPWVPAGEQRSHS